MPIFNPIPPFTFLDESDMPINVRDESCRNRCCALLFLNLECLDIGHSARLLFLDIVHKLRRRQSLLVVDGNHEVFWFKGDDCIEAVSLCDFLFHSVEIAGHIVG